MELTAESVIDFGMYKGEMLKDLPWKYMIFLSGYTWDGNVRSKCESPAFLWVLENKRHYHEYAVKYWDRRCYDCGGRLKPFTVTSDWTSRYLHKKCWREIQNRRDIYGE